MVRRRKQRHQRIRRATRQRRGAVVLIVLMALLFLSVISVAFVKLALAERRQMLREANRLQSEWLAEAGRQRALLQREQDNAFTGEQWQVAWDDREALVKTTVRENAGAREVDIIADFPLDPARRARVVKTIVVPVREIE